MPEYSSTTITPADGVKTPAMNGSTSGNYTLSALRDFILASKGQANGLASLGADGKLTSTQLPDLADDVLVYDSYALLPNPGIAGKIYITADNNEMYRWDDALTTPDYVELSVDLRDYALVSEIQDGTIQAGVAVQAWQDILGNAIITTYETKAEANDLKNAIDANSKRITNLEQKAGDEIVVDYPSQTYGMDEVPANVAEYAKVTKLRGVSRVENSLITEATKTGSAEGLSYSRVNNHVTVTGTYQSGGDSNAYIFSNDVMPEINGHNYLVFVTNPKFSLYIFGATTAGVQNAIVFPATASGQMQLTARATGFSNGATVNESFDVIVRDLTLYFNGTIPSDADTIAEIQQNYPELLIPSDYDAGSLVSTTYSAVKSVGVNIWDEEMESGYWRVTDGVGVADANKLRCKNPIPVFPSTAYYLKFPTASGLDINYTFFDINQNYIDGGFTTLNTSVTTPPNAYYMKFYMADAYGTTYNHDIQICDNSLPDAIKTIYHPYMTDTLSLPTPVTGKSAGSVHQIYYPETGEMTEPISDKVTYDGSNDESWALYGNSTFYIVPSVAFKGASSSATKANISSNRLIPVARDNIYNAPLTICTESTYFMVTFPSTVTDVTSLRTWLASNPIDIWYELATPNPNSQATEPVLDPFIQVEGGGTIRPIQTQTPEIDSAMTAEYLSLGA